MAGSYLDPLLSVVVDDDGTAVAKAGGAAGGGLNFTAPLTAVRNPATGKVDVGVVAAPVVGNITVTTITLDGQTQPLISGPYTLVTTDATAHTLKSIAIPVAATLNAEIQCIAVLGTGPNANRSPCVYRFATIGGREGSDAAVGLLDNDHSSVSAPFVDAQNSATPGPGSANVTASGNSVLFQVVGFAIKEAWTVGHTYTNGDGMTTPGDFVTANGGAWVCVGSGTASGSAPTGTGRNQGTGAQFDYVGPASGSSVTVSWTMVVTGLVGSA